MGQKRKLKKTIPLDLGIPLGMDSEYYKIISSGENQAKRVFRAMLDRGICGVSALVPSPPNPKALKQFLERISLIANLSDPLAIVGESGTGKDSMARVIGDIRGSESKAPFVKIDCSIPPPDLIPSELFGHVKGAFTGAISNKKGKIELAKGGTCFLDELGKMPKQAQASLLQVIEYKTYTPVGAVKEETLEGVKFVVSLLPDDISGKTINPELMNRLNLDSAINLPPLHDRLKKDPDLVLDFLHKLLRRSDIQQMLGIDSAGLQGAEITVQKPQQQKKIIDEIKGIVSEEILNSIKTWRDYKKIRLRLGFGGKIMSIERKALNQLVGYEGYTGKNFRLLEGILEFAIGHAHLEKRKMILLEDLPADICARHKQQHEEGLGKTLYPVEDISLNEIIQHGEKVKRSIIENKIDDIYRSGKKIKPIMLKDLGLTLKEYTNFMNKLPRILGKGRLTEIRNRYK